MGEIEDLRKMLIDHEKRIKKLESTQVTKPHRSNKPSGKVTVPGLLLELKEEGFFKQPKSLDEIRTKLSHLGHHYPRTSLSGPLQNAVQKRILGRIENDDGTYGYVNR